jgi:hypothetical protein
MMWRSDFEDCCREDDRFDRSDPHLVRCRPVEDDEAEIIEAICLAAMPGPLVTDDLSSGGGALVATLPDGRSIVSVRPPSGSPDDARSMASANAQLICEARCLLLRLLRDRQRWKRREEGLAERIGELEALLDAQYERADSEWPAEDPAPVRPR